MHRVSSLASVLDISAERAPAPAQSKMTIKKRKKGYSECGGHVPGATAPGHVAGAAELAMLGRGHLTPLVALFRM